MNRDKLDFLVGVLGRTLLTFLLSNEDKLDADTIQRRSADIERIHGIVSKIYKLEESKPKTRNWLFEKRPILDYETPANLIMRGMYDVVDAAVVFTIYAHWSSNQEL